MKLPAHLTPISSTHHARRVKTRAPLACSVGIFAFSAMVAGAANITWDGGGAVNNAGWTNPLNWVADLAPLAGDALIFDGTAGLANTNDFTAGTTFNGITFNAGAGAFVLAGSGISLFGNLTSNSALAETIALDLDLQTSTTARVNGAGQLTLGGVVSGFGTGLTKAGPGTLLLTHAGNSYTGTTTVAGGVLSLGTTGALASSSALTLSGGEFKMTGTSAAPSVQVLGALTLGLGRNVITLAADAAQPIALVPDFLASRAPGATTLFRGTALGTVASGTPGVANILFTTAPTAVTGVTTGANNLFAATGSGALGTTQAAVLRGSIVEVSATGGGSGFATYDAVNGVRALTASERTTTYSTATIGENVLINLTAATSITGKQTNTLQVANTTAGALTLTNSGAALFPANGLLFTGTSAITLTGGSLTQANTSGVNSDVAVYSSNTAGVTIATTFTTSGGSQRSFTFGGPGNFTISSSNIGSAGAGGNFFNGPGTVTLRSTAYGPSSTGTVVNGGAVILGTGFALNTNVTRPLAVAAGAIFDINNISVGSSATSGVDAINNVSGLGGTVQNSGGTLTNLTLSLNNGAGNFAGTIGGNLNLVLNKQGTGGNNAQKLTGVNTYAGSTAVTSNSATQTTAFLTLGAGGVLPATTVVTLGGGVGLATGSGVLALGDGNGPSSQTIAGLATSGTGAANAVVGGNGAISTLTVAGAASTVFNGVIGGFGVQDSLALTRAGTGSLTLTGANTYAGGTTISGGILKVNNIAGSGTGSGAVDVLGGTLGGSGTIDGTVTVSAGGHVAPGNSVGTLTVGALTLSAGAVLDWEFNATPPNDLLYVTGADAFTLLGGGFNLYTEGTPTSFDTIGTYNLMHFEGALQGGGTGALSVLNQQPGRTYSFGTSGNFVTLTIGSGNVGQPSNWALAGGASWGGGASWSTNPTVPNASAAIANFGAAISGPSTVTLDGTKTAGTITFANANGYTIAQGSGGNLRLENGAGTASVSVTSGSHAITAPVTLVSNTNLVVNSAADTLTVSGPVDGAGSLTKIGAGTLVLGGANTHAGTVLSGGVTQIGSDGNLGVAAATLVVNNATLHVTASTVSTRSVQLGSAGSTILVDAAAVHQIDGNVTESAAGTLHKTGAGTLILNAPSSYTGGTNLTGGTLQIGGGGSIGTGPLTATVGAGDTVTITGSIVGAGNLAASGGGTLLLSSNNAGYSGAVTIAGGVLSLGASNAAGVGTLALNGATLREENVSTTSTNPIAFTGANFIDTFGGGNVMTLNGAISGAGTITRDSGTGTLTFGNAGGNASFTGTFANTSGNVSFTQKAAGSAAAQWSFTAGTVTMTSINGTISFGALSGTSNINGTGNAARLNIGNLGLDTTYSGNLTGGANMALVKVGAGALTLSGANVMSGLGISGLAFPTVVARGTLIAAASTNGAASGPLGGANSVVLLGNGASGVATASLSNASLLTGGAFTLENSITVSSGTNTVTPAGYVLTLGGQTDSASTFSGAITLENNLTVAQAATTGGNALLLSGGIFGTAAGTGPGGAGTGPGNTGAQVVTFAGPGAIKVSGTISDGGGAVGVRVTDGTVTFSAVNSYTGATAVDGGKLVFATSQTLTGDLTIADGATVILGAASFAPAPAESIFENGDFEIGGDASATAVPEPSTIALLSLSALGFFKRRR